MKKTCLWITTAHPDGTHEHCGKPTEYDRRTHRKRDFCPPHQAVAEWQDREPVGHAERLAWLNHKPALF